MGSRSLTVKYVAPEFVHQLWPKIEKYLADAAAFSAGTLTADQAKIYLVRGDWHLLIDIDDDDRDAIHGAAALHFVSYSNDRVGFVNLIGGKMIAHPENFVQLVDFCKSHGATCIQGAARPAIIRLWRKLFGFYEKYMIVEKKI